MSGDGRPGRKRNELRGESAGARELAQMLREIADDKGMSVRAIAQQIPCGKSTVSDNLTGEGRPPWEFVARYLRACAGGDRQAASVLEAKVRPVWEAAASRTRPTVPSALAVRQDRSAVADDMVYLLAKLTEENRQLTAENDALRDQVHAYTNPSRQAAEELRGELTEKLSATVLRMARLQWLTAALAGALTLPEVVEGTAQVSRNAVGALTVSVAILEPGPGAMHIRVIDSQFLTAYQLDASVSCVIGRAIRTQRPVFVADIDDLRCQFSGEADPEPERAEGEMAWTALPLITADGAIGALRLAFGCPHEVPEEERDFLAGLAEQCALAVQRAMRYADALSSRPSPEYAAYGQGSVPAQGRDRAPHGYVPRHRRAAMITSSLQ